MYPTKEKITNHRVFKTPDKKTIQLIYEWKQEYYLKKWKNSPINVKIIAITCLIHMILPNAKIHWIGPWAAHLEKQTIIANPTNISIISALHEIGHLIHGESELLACAFSDGLFKACFPKEFSRLSWEGHMLIKK